MNMFVYFILFLIGIFFGSFFTLAVHRIPLHQDILYKHSYCPKCNHKLGVFDLIPVISYIALGGKCRYCGQKVRIRYLLLEILSGTVFALVGYTMNLGVNILDNSLIIEIVFLLLYFVSLFIIAGIDKEKVKVDNYMMIYAAVLSLIYIIYLCILRKSNIYAYVIYLCMMLIFVLINIIYLKRKLEFNYTIEVLILCTYMVIFSGEIILAYSILLALLFIGMVKICKILLKKKIQDNNKIPIAFYICVSNIILILINNYFVYHRF